MKKLYSILVIMVCAMTFVQAQDTLTVTFRVTLKGSGRKLNSDSLRVTGALGSPSQKDWDPPTAKNLKLLSPASDSIYGITIKVPRPANDTAEFKFINGKTWGDGTVATDNYTEDERGVTAPCIKAGNGYGNRILVTKNLTGAILAPAYVFNTCKQVFASSTFDLTTAQKLSVYPNPVLDRAVLSFENISKAAHTIDVLNIMGQIVHVFPSTTESEVPIEMAQMAKGLYFARLRNTLGETATVKFVVE